MDRLIPRDLKLSQLGWTASEIVVLLSSVQCAEMFDFFSTPEDLVSKVCLRLIWKTL